MNRWLESDSILYIWKFAWPDAPNEARNNTFRLNAHINFLVNLICILYVRNMYVVTLHSYVEARMVFVMRRKCTFFICPPLNKIY